MRSERELAVVVLFLCFGSFICGLAGMTVCFVRAFEVQRSVAFLCGPIISQASERAPHYHVPPHLHCDLFQLLTDNFPLCLHPLNPPNTE